MSELTMISFSPLTFCRLLLRRISPLGTVATPFGVTWFLPFAGPEFAAEVSPFTIGESELEETAPFSKSGSYFMG